VFPPEFLSIPRTLVTTPLMTADDKVNALTSEERGQVDVPEDSSSTPDSSKGTTVIPRFTDQSRVLPPKELAAVFAG